MIARAPATPRWALSFADLCLVLIAFLLLMQAERTRPAAVAGIRAAFGAPATNTAPLDAAALFQPGEAILLPAARARLAAIGRAAASAHARVRVDSEGRDRDAARFDGWELAAARTAATARAIAAGGLDPGRVTLSLDGGDARSSGQRLTITTGG